MTGLWQDARYALRLICLNPGFALVAVVSIALGTGANTAIFQLLDAIRLQNLPVPAPQELITLRVDDMTHARGSWLRDNALTNPLWEQIRAHDGVLQGSFAWADEPFAMSTQGEYRPVAGLWVSGDFFRVLGVKPLLGRVFTTAEDQRGCGLQPGAVVSYEFWRRELARDATAIGRRIAIGENKIVVIGVTPPNFFGLEVGRRFDIALPICAEPQWHRNEGLLDSGTTWWLTVMGRLRPGVSVKEADVYFRSISRGIFEASLPANYPTASVKPYLAMKLLAIPAGSGISRLRDQYSVPLGLLMGIAGLVLTIACANLANLMLARASTRQREIAIRLALGASRPRLVQQLLTEGLLLAVVGAAFGLMMARAVSHLLLSFLTTADDPLAVNLSLGWRTFGFTAALAIVTCILFALMPAIRAVGPKLGGALKAGSRGTTSGREPLTLRRALAASQIALSFALVVSALLFVRSLQNLETLDPGFDASGVLVADVDFSGVHLPSGRAISFRRDILESFRRLPGVVAASEATVIPANGADWNNRMWMDGEKAGEGRVAMRSMVGAGYFQTLKMPLLAGREIVDRDLASFSNVAVVNEEFAQAFSGGSNAVGRKFWIEATPYYPETAYEIVGVVKNAKYHDMREDFQPVAFTAFTKEALSRPSARFIVRSSLPPSALVASVRASLAGISPYLQYAFHFIERWIQESLLRERLMATLSGIFGSLAMLLAGSGLYGVISYAVARRTSEIGVRVALGASRRKVIGLILRETGIVLVSGLCIGIAISLATWRASATFLFGVRPQEPLISAAAAIAISIVAALASYLPARRACDINPVIALRQE